MGKLSATHKHECCKVLLKTTYFFDFIREKSENLQFLPYYGRIDRITVESTVIREIWLGRGSFNDKFGKMIFFGLARV